MISLKSISLALTIIGVGALLSACGDELLLASFTSRVVQLEACRTVGSGAEGCSRNEVVAERQLDLVEVEPDVLWLYGVPRNGAADRSILGTRDTAGGFLFVDESTQRDGATGCAVTTRVELSLAFEQGRELDVGSDDCIALVGRSVDTVLSTAACDAVNLPAQPVRQIIRRRFEPIDPTSTCGE